MVAFASKTVRHSALRARGPVRVLFTHRVMDSRFKGQLPYAPFRVEGCATSFTLSVENDDIRATLDTIPLDRWVTVTATGRDGDARLLVETHEDAAGRTRTPSVAPDALDDAVALVAAFVARFGREPSAAEAAAAAVLWKRAA